MITFQSMDLPESLVHSLSHMKFTTPTPIQEKTIPVAIQGRDILGSAQTGTGKTGAFGIPLVRHLISNESGVALVMTPTRELASQVMAQINDMLGRKSKINAALLIGGASMFKQLEQLKRSPRVIVGTPGRIFDHLERGSLKLDNASFLVLDETDRMLDMGFSIQIDQIMKYMSASRQTLLFSATLPKNIVRVADKYLSNPVRVEVGATSLPAENIEHSVKRLSHQEKYPELLAELDARTGSIIIFVKTKMGAQKLAKQLFKEGHSAEAIHGDLRQHKRDRIIAGFRKYKYRILVATDVASRGLDIPHIEHVINYDLPQVAEDYIHRIGRTARAGAKGEALCFVTPDTRRMWDQIDYLMNPDKPRPSKSKGGSKRFGSKSNDRKREGFKPKRASSGGYRSRDNSDGYKPKREGSEGGFRPKRNSEGFKPKKEGSAEGAFRSKRNSEGFKPKREGSEGTFRSNRNSEGFRPKREGSESNYRPKRNSEGFKPKREGSSEDFRSRRSGSNDNFRSKKSGADFKSRKPKTVVKKRVRKED